MRLKTVDECITYIRESMGLESHSVKKIVDPALKTKKLTVNECIAYLLESINNIGLPKEKVSVKQEYKRQDPDPEQTDELFLKANTPMIYAFITPQVPNSIKVGYTDQGVQQREDLIGRQPKKDHQANQEGY